MTRFAVGDLQGCLKPLLCLLEAVHFQAHKDQLWLVGDLINRGPQSLETLRYLKALDDKHPNAIRLVLGNHDLHFLAVAHGTRRVHKSDTLDALLQAPDCQELVHWLCQKPLLYTDPSGDYTMVHAGIPPIWSLQQAEDYAREVEAVLQSDNRTEFFQQMYGNQPDCWQDDLTGWDRLRLITNYLTRMRFCSPSGRLELNNKTEHSDDSQLAPWFSFNPQCKQTLLFGHWAALEGRTDNDRVFALDTGCVWGGALTLLNLEDSTSMVCQCQGKSAGQ